MIRAFSRALAGRMLKRPLRITPVTTSSRPLRAQPQICYLMSGTKSTSGLRVAGCATAAAVVACVPTLTLDEGRTISISCQPAWLSQGNTCCIRIDSSYDIFQSAPQFEKILRKYISITRIVDEDYGRYLADHTLELHAVSHTYIKL